MKHPFRTLALAAAAVVATSAAAPGLAAQAEPLAIGDFLFAAMQDDATAQDRSLLATMARRDGYREPSLVWRCMDDGLNVMYNWDKYFIGNAVGGADVRFRFADGELSETVSWDISTDHSAAFLPVDRVVAFTRAALASGRVQMYVQDSDGERLADTFPLGDLAAGLERLPCAGPVADAPPVEADTSAAPRR